MKQRVRNKSCWSEMAFDGDPVGVGSDSPTLTLEALIAAIRPENIHGEQNWGEPVGEEENLL
ncbi:MAG TPA: hypothetical protein VJN48_05860 [Terriglobales bacterium]|jgi:hypothetical protein|nr:hypothetical protein [Terriglobales bacterium]